MLIAWDSWIWPEKKKKQLGFWNIWNMVWEIGDELITNEPLRWGILIYPRIFTQSWVRCQVMEVWHWPTSQVTHSYLQATEVYMNNESSPPYELMKFVSTSLKRRQSNMKSWVLSYQAVISYLKWLHMSQHNNTVCAGHFLSFVKSLTEA